MLILIHDYYYYSYFDIIIVVVIYFLLLLVVCVGERETEGGREKWNACGGQRTTLWNWFPPPTAAPGLNSGHEA